MSDEELLWLVTAMLCIGQMVIFASSGHGDCVDVFQAEKMMLCNNGDGLRTKRELCMTEGLLAFYPRFCGYEYLVPTLDYRRFSTRGREGRLTRAGGALMPEQAQHSKIGRSSR